jgi:type VI secretion system Hcp family effector
MGQVRAAVGLVARQLHPWVEAVESRVMLSATVTYRPTGADGKLGTPVVFETGGSVRDFSPQQVSLLQKGFAAPQFDMFLAIDGIPGQSQDAKHKDQIDVLAFNWGADATHSTTTGGGGGAGKSVLHELHFTAAVSKASPKIIEALTTGRHERTANLAVRSAGKDQSEFLKINLDDVLISSYQVSTARDGTLQEEFTLNFAEADLEYRARRPDGSLDAPITAHATGPAEDFAPEQQSIFQEGFAAPSTSLSYFLDVDGIPGESTDAKHKDQLSVLAFGWGGDSTSAAIGGGGAGTGKTVYHEMHFVSPLSKASPKLLDAMATGKHISDARFAAVRSGKDQVEFYTITLEDVLVSSYQVKTSPTGQLVEEFTLSFNDAGFEYRPQNPDGSLGSPVVFHETGTDVQDFKPAQRSLLDTGNLSSGSTDVFLSLEGIPGESTDAKHKDHIDVLSFEWGGDAVGGSNTGGGGGAGKSTLQTVHVTSRISKASPLILAKINSGTHLSFADLTFRRSSKDQVEFLKVNLDDVLIDSYRVTTAGDGTPIEEYTLTFDQAAFEYRPQKPDGSLDAPVTFQETGLGIEHFNAPQTSVLQDGFSNTSTVDYFLHLDGIPGESTDAKHKDAIGVLAFGWGANGLFDTGTGGGGGAGRTVFHELHFVAPVSKASPKLLAATTSGLHIRDAILTAVKNGADQFQFLKVELQDVQVSSYQVVLGAQGQFLEEFTLSFDDAKVDYTAQDETGRPAGTTTGQVTDAQVEDFAPAQRSLLYVDGLLTPASIDGFLQIDGVKGESTDAKHKDNIDILSFSWGADAVGGSNTGGGGGAGKSILQEVHVLSRFSGASPSILDLLDTGRHVPKSSLVLRKSSKDQVEFYKINLDDVTISSYQVTTARDGTFLEEYTLSFDKATQEYRPQRPDGTLDAPIVFQATGLDVQDFAPTQRSIVQDGFAAPGGTNLFLDIDGIPGESTDSKHKDEVAIQAFSWGGDATVGTLGSGGRTGKTQFHEFHFVSRVSKASPRLLDRLVKGQHIQDATLTVRRSSTGNEFLKIKLVDVLISSYQVTTAPDGTLVEEFTLSFGPGGVFGAPTADAGGPYSVGDGQTVTLDASGTGDVDDDPAALTYQWDLDGDGVFGETGAGAARGDEVGIHPVFSAAGLFGPQTLNVSLKVTDPAGHTSTDAASISVVDVTPPETTITSGPPTLTNQTSAAFTFTGSDQGTPANQLTFSAELDGGPRFAVTSPLNLTALSDGTHTLRLFAKDLAGNEDPTPAVYTWKVDTVGPNALNLLANPKAVSVGATATLTATISDLLTGASAIAAAEYSLDGIVWRPLRAADGAFDSAQETVTGKIPSLPAGVYTVLVRGIDAAGNAGPASALTLPVFDRDAGFVTGGGHFDSPAGALSADPSQAGAAKVEVSAKYGKTGNQPSGKVSFQFGKLKFDSTGLDWLVITGNQARLAGTGTINGAGDYAFDLTLIDGKLGKGSGGDFFRIRITDRTTGRVIYDNGLNLPPSAPPPSLLLGGNMKIHS